MDDAPKPKGRPGRKSKAEEFGLKRLLDKCWTERQREDCIRALAGKAGDGDLEAIKLLLAYCFGKPTEKREHSGSIGVNVIFAEDFDV